MEQTDYILQISGINKSFSGVPALTNVGFNVRCGTVHALMGENGAGKSTMMKILLGIYTRDSGTIIFDGKDVHFKTPRAALDQGLAMIHQELSTVQDLKVYENIFLGKEILYKGTPIKNEHAMRTETQKLFDSMDIAVDPNVKMGTLSVAKQQLCEIAKAVSYNAKLIIMDEPTSAITGVEVEKLFQLIRKLRNQGVSIIYITHKMDEVFEICDDISVFRDGCFIGTNSANDITIDDLINMMVGRTISNIFPKENAEIGEAYLRVEGLSRKGEFEDISFEVHRGEILGMGGLMGAGRTEVVETIFGARKKTAGKIYVGGKEVTINTPKDAIRHGIGMVTEDRKQSGCFLPLSIRLNAVMAALSRYCKGFFVQRKKTEEAAASIKESLSVKAPSTETIISNLSGGNQQKVLIGRWLLTNPDILIFDEPTRGIDVGSKAEIHRLISDLAKQGKCIIMVSSELPEVMGMSDRILVMHEGKLTGFVDRENFSQETIMRYATGFME